MNIRLFSVITSSALALTAGAAWSQEVPQSTAGASELDEVLITAQRRSESLQRAPASVSVRNGDDLEAEGKYSLSAILEDVPGVSGGAASNTLGAPGSPAGTDSPAAGLNIRGIPSNQGVGGSAVSVATSAALYVDGVYSGVGGSYDINLVEVLRGPQGTLYGRSATSGVVTIRTNNPALDDFGFDATVEAGGENLRHVTGALNVPIIEGRLGLRVSGNYFDRDGYFSEGDAFTNEDLRAKLLFLPNDAVSILLGYAQQDNTQHSGGVTFNVSLADPDVFVETPGPVGVGENSFRQYWAEVNWSLGDMTLTYQPAFRTWESSANNIAILALPVPPVFPGFGVNQIIDTPMDEFTTHELRLASGTDNRLTWQIGAAYYHNALENHIVSSNPFTGGLQFESDTEKTTESIGAFGEATYAFSDTWRGTIGVRYDQTDVGVEQAYTAPPQPLPPPPGPPGPPGPPVFGPATVYVLTGPAGERSFSNGTYKLRLEHDLTPDNLLYVMTATGFSPGDIAVTTGIDGLPYVVEFDAETLTSYEVGSKNMFLDNRLRLNASAFYYDYGAYQVASIATGATPAGDAAFSAISTPARAYGAEVELTYRATPNDLFAFNLGYTRGDLLDTENQVVPGTGGRTADQFFADSSTPGIIPLSAQFSYDRIVDLSNGSSLMFRSGVRYNSAYDASEASQAVVAAGYKAWTRVDEQVLGDISATWISPDDSFSMTAYVRNIGDNEHLTGRRIISLSPAQVSATTNLSEPFTFGIVLSARR